MKRKYLILPFILYLVLLVFFYNHTQNYALTQVELRVKEYLQNYKALRTYTREFQKPEVYRLQHENILDGNYFSPMLLSTTFGVRAVNSFYNKIRVEENQEPLILRFASKNARNPVNQADTKESNLIDKYNKKALEGEYKEIVKTKDGRVFYYVLPTKENEQKCMKCHSDPSLAPKQLIETYGDKRGFYEKVGHMRAIISTSVNIENDITFANKLFIYLWIITTLIFGIIIFLVEKFTKKIEDKAALVSSILDSQQSMVILTEGSKIIRANRSLFKFLGIKDLTEFFSKYNCICDLFLEKEGTYCNRDDKRCDNWIDHMISLENEKKIVVMESLQKEQKVFLVKFEPYAKGDHRLVITFTDITELNKLQRNLESLVDEKTKELKEINSSLEDRIKLEVEKNSEKDRQIYESVKMAQMGEMIGNIAHQWRQPLSSISTAASGIKFRYEIGDKPDEKDILIYMDSITRSTEFLSDTVDTFRDFVKEKNEVKDIILQERIEKIITIVKASFDDQRITINVDDKIKEPISLKISPSDLSQVVINILNNARDALLLKDINEPSINITLQKVDEKVIIAIEDNAGGVPEDILPKIFDPYFTTKHQSQGTGLGLHLAYVIVTRSLNGNLYVKNSSCGAEFFIELPLS